MNRLAGFFALLVFALTVPARASLIGTSVTGSFNINGVSGNLFDAANGSVPAVGFLNSGGATTVLIGEPAIEFGYHDSQDTITANFTNTQLIITDFYFGPGSHNGASFTFNDPAFTGISLSSNSYPGAPTFSDVANLITVSVPAVAAANLTAGSTYSTTFNVTSVPEPPSLLPVSAGLVLLSLVMSRRRPAA